MGDIFGNDFLRQARRALDHQRYQQQMLNEYANQHLRGLAGIGGIGNNHYSGKPTKLPEPEKPKSYREELQAETDEWLND